jgi:hypothetical protein
MQRVPRPILMQMAQMIAKIFASTVHAVLLQTTIIKAETAQTIKISKHGVTRTMLQPEVVHPTLLL